jgi:hypothetical protein
MTLGEPTGVRDPAQALFDTAMTGASMSAGCVAQVPARTGSAKKSRTSLCRLDWLPLSASTWSPPFSTILAAMACGMGSSPRAYAFVSADLLPSSTREYHSGARR